MQISQVIENHKLHKGEDYIKLLDSIKNIKNLMQVEPMRQLIDLFGKKTGDAQLKQELLQNLLDKARHYQHYDIVHNSSSYGLSC